MPDKNRTRRPDEPTRRPDTEDGLEQDRWREENDDDEGRRFGGVEEENFRERKQDEGDRGNEGDRGRTPRSNPPRKDR